MEKARLLILLQIVFGLLIAGTAAGSSDEQCQSVLEAVASSSGSCVPLGNCTGLTCLDTAGADIRASFTVDKCQDPLLVTVTLTELSSNQTLLYDTFNQSTIIDDLQMNLTINRNDSHVWIEVAKEGHPLVPQTAVPLNTSDCMCQSIQAIINTMETPVETNCVNNSQCSGTECTFLAFEQTYEVETDVLPCTDPPGILFIIKSGSVVVFEHFYNSSSDSVLLFDQPLHVLVIHRPYSLIVEIIYTVNNYAYQLVPLSQIILDRSKCRLPSLPMVTSSPMVTPTPPPTFISSATCDKLREIAANISNEATCMTNHDCDTVSCSLFSYRSNFQLLPCLNTTGFNVIIYDNNDNVIYHEIVTETTSVAIGTVSVTFIIDHSLANAVGLEVYFLTPFPFDTTIDIVPYTVIPIDRCLCPQITCTTSSSFDMSTSSQMQTTFLIQPTHSTTSVRDTQSSVTTSRKSESIRTQTRSSRKVSIKTSQTMKFISTQTRPSGSAPAKTSYTTVMKLESIGTQTSSSQRSTLAQTPTPQTGLSVSLTAIAVSVPLVVCVILLIAISLVILGLIIFLMRKDKYLTKGKEDPVLFSELSEEKVDFK